MQARSISHENLITALVRSTAVIELDLGGHVLTANDRFLGSRHHRL
jgi:methyl-accepting chemotaxis protein